MRSCFRVFPLLFLLLLIATSAFCAEVVVPFKSGEATITQLSDKTSSLSVPGFCSYCLPGDPALPNTQSYVLLPPNADPATIQIEIRNSVEEPVVGHFSVQPTPPFMADVDGKQAEYWAGRQIVDRRNVDIYGKDEFYPSNFVTTDSEGKLGPYRLLPITFWPYRFNPVTGQLVHLVSGDVAVTFQTLRTITSITDSQKARAMAGRLKDVAMNWDQGASWYGTRSITDVQPVSGIPFTIITTSAIANASTELADYVAHKTNMGFNVTLATESDWGGGTGDAAAENIRNWLKANYDTKAQYALLIGNPDPASGDVPMKMCTPMPGGAYPTAPTDYYYADISGNWDINDDGQYAEPYVDFTPGGVDRIPEVIVGRIPYYGNIADLDNILQKIVTFETATTVGNWAQKILLPMKPLDDTTPCYQVGEGIINDFANPIGIKHYRIYDSNYGLSPLPEAYPCTENAVLTAWKTGYGFVFWDTHGSTQAASSVFSNINCGQLDDTKPSFTFQGSCDNGYPESSNNLGYSLLKNGAIATVSASRVSWYWSCESNYDYSDSILGMTYHYAQYLVGQRERCGDALFDMKVKGPDYNWANHLVFNLYGDPTVRPTWPTTMSIDTSSVTPAVVGNTYSFQFSSYGGTLPNTWTLDSGVLPTGLTLAPSGLLSGTPTEDGCFAFTVCLSDSASNSLKKSYSVEVRTSAYKFDLETNPGWTCQGQWAYGKPTGAAAENGKDPSSGHTGNNVYGYNLNGGYANSISTPQYLITTAIDCSNLYKTRLSFWRWLGVGQSTGDNAAVYVSNDKSTWTRLWFNPNSTATMDSFWTQCSYDISAVADGSPTVYIRWSMGATNSSGTYAGWNIDDVEILGEQFRSMTSVSDAKVLRDGTPVKFGQQLVASGVFGLSFYAQQADGYSGILVYWPYYMVEGTPVTIFGTMDTLNGERRIVAQNILYGTPGEKIQPVGLSLKAVGGAGLGSGLFGQTGVTSGFGPNNIGTLVKIWGQVTQTGSDYFYIDDGSGLMDGTMTGGVDNVGVRVNFDPTGLTSGQFITVTGISSLYSTGNDYAPVVLPRSSTDIY